LVLGMIFGLSLVPPGVVDPIIVAIGVVVPAALGGGAFGYVGNRVDFLKTK